MMVNFDLHKVLQTLIPFEHRKARCIAWVRATGAGLNDVKGYLYELWALTDREAKMTPQIIYLEKFLNDKFGEQDIVIAEGTELGPWCFYGGPPQGDVDMFMTEPDNFCFSYSTIISIDFIVKVPGYLLDYCNLIAAYVYKYKLAGKSFIIQLI